MTIGESIRSWRKERGLTQKALGEKLGVSQATVGQYETNPNPPKIDTLSKIADALGVPLTLLIGAGVSTPWDVALDQKLSHIGYSIGFYEEDANVWINYPDGTLEVTSDQLKNLNEAVNSYLRFQLAELKTNNMDRFRKK